MAFACKKHLQQLWIRSKFQFFERKKKTDNEDEAILVLSLRLF
jgi:hypothetical protein